MVRLMLLFKYFTIIVAGGSGHRFGGDMPKLLHKLGNRTIIEYSITSAYKSSTQKIVLVAPKNHLEQYRKIAEKVAPEKMLDVIPGGETRTKSVRIGLERLQNICGDDDIVAIHDGARPLIPYNLFDKCADAANKYGAAIAAIPVVDTIKIVENKTIVSTPDRDVLWSAQTPQAFKFKIINDAMADSKIFTDDAAAVEAFGQKVHIVVGERQNIKITVPEDIIIAEAILAVAGSK